MNPCSMLTGPLLDANLGMLEKRINAISKLLTLIRSDIQKSGKKHYRIQAVNITRRASISLFNSWIESISAGS